MNRRSINIWQLVGFAITGLGGTLLHFLYEWSGQLKCVAPFASINESTWEHMKLLFWPMFIFAIIQSFFFRDYKSFWCIKLKGIILGLVAIPVIFYTYNGVIGKSPDWINIVIFFIAAMLTYVYEAIQFKGKDRGCRFSKAAFFALCIIALLFVLFTFYTPEIDIFKDPITNNLGL